MQRINVENDEKLSILTRKCVNLREKVKQKPTKTGETMSIPLLQNSTSIVHLEMFEHDTHEKLLCDYCDFIGKPEGGLKTNMRFKLTNLKSDKLETL